VDGMKWEGKNKRWKDRCAEDLPEDEAENPVLYKDISGILM
jgi:hypothetical protein